MTDEQPTTRSMLWGRTIRHVETQVLVDQDRLGVELHFTDGLLARVAPSPRPKAYTVATGIRCALEWRFVDGRKRRVDTQRLYHLGDGSQDQKALNAMLGGRTIIDFEEGAQTQEGYEVSRLRLDTSIWVIVSPLALRVPGRDGPLWVMVFMQSRTPGLIVAGQGFLGEPPP